MLPLQEHDNTNKTIHILCLCLRRGPMILNFNVLGPSAGDLFILQRLPSQEGGLEQHREILESLVADGDQLPKRQAVAHVQIE